MRRRQQRFVCLSARNMLKRVEITFFIFFLCISIFSLSTFFFPFCFSLLFISLYLFVRFSFFLYFFTFYSIFSHCILYSLFFFRSRIPAIILNTFETEREKEIKIHQIKNPTLKIQYFIHYRSPCWHMT